MTSIQIVRRWGLILGILLVVVFGLILLLTFGGSREPHGRYVEPHILLINATAFFEFKDGKVFLVDEGPPKQLGTYLKKGKQWEWITSSGDVALIKWNYLTLTVQYSTNSQESETFKRYYYWWLMDHLLMRRDR